MPLTYPILATSSAGISELKKNPMAVINDSEGAPIAILNRNRPVFYAVPTAAWEMLMDRMEDLELAQIVQEREGEEEIEIDKNEL